jgi:hypothetical protein
MFVGSQEVEVGRDMRHKEASGWGGRKGKEEEGSPEDKDHPKGIGSRKYR